MVGESRQELLTWCSELLQLNITKIESCGTGATYCQIFDSVYQTVPLNKVKFNAKSEYEYVDNFKILQAAFKRHKIDKPIPVEQLMKCKMQDNLEFMQWYKRWWDQFYPGGDYDAVARRKGQLTNSAAPTMSHNRTVSSASSAHTRASATAPAPAAARAVARPGAASARAPLTTATTRAPAASTATVAQTAQLKRDLENLTADYTDLDERHTALEKERDFYFEKLQDIESLVTNRLESGVGEISESEQGSLEAIQKILYSTAPGFELPVEGLSVEDDGDPRLLDEDEENLEETY
ncbi:uncharacterized protein L969DRAFT_16057 [Mixia osmundae IAM 14324]|uniref:EB1 C-terminal domain-containing protein n=1 Tax=Mixia osmundae (strain CBS 9802 / IAM 14324 / JCM 22182 / KY 12970) TaxID=764103 RepID=G7E5P8_MIXOS|nr:uncharacterized protein L969DRAFT_16057 [Mixia osmundae IAM 14324]KEI40693.1 hypothetical protein L969DRAFT_16057 [Mixia osmundae IAM 14324]GAA98158.1 hypothetical protein E5Q_04841 [Mixia osmundae IAM 14324]